ncbi:Protein of unknown function [Pedobacter steynii]|uniref:DUF2867 domain-containing protein n=1 Tax=Pedobacter steynii TaxID=430522 RepID=A0A1G9PAH5_9SPHI|nr:DUF2867 domain-containing protein [Pedobacter steynii]NQX39048.1 DUF2867 domain-containing protein [Pedobacter steynii]SDL95573.1 Protein of unknown function [Pedobacter steynii]
MIVKARKDAPENSQIRSQIFDYWDCFQGVLIEKGNRATPSQICIAFLTSVRELTQKLLLVKHKVFSFAGGKAAEANTMPDLNTFNYQTGEQLGLLKVFYRNEDEILLGANTKRINLRISLFLEEVQTEPQRSLSFTTTVVYNDFFGRIIFFLIKPLHKILARYLLKSMIEKIQHLGIPNN